MTVDTLGLTSPLLFPQGLLWAETTSFFGLAVTSCCSLFLEGGEGKEKEREGENCNIWLPLPPPPTGDLAHNPGTCPDWESNGYHLVHRTVLNPLRHTRHQPKQLLLLLEALLGGHGAKRSIRNWRPRTPPLPALEPGLDD